MKRLILAIILVIGVVLVGYYYQTDKERNGKNTVAIINLGSHPILDSSIQGIKDALQTSGSEVEIREYSANMQMSEIDGLVRMVMDSRPSLIIPVSTPIAKAVVLSDGRDPKTPIVYSTVTDPGDLGIDSVSNITGVSDVVNFEANLELLLELFPEVKRIGMPYNPSEANSVVGVNRTKAIAAKLDVEIITVPVSNSNEVESATRVLIGQSDAIYIGSDNTVAAAIPAVINTAYPNGIPVIASDVGSVENGALAAVSVNYVELGQQVGEIARRVLSSEQSASEIPPVQHFGNTLILNQSAASRLDYEFPDSVLGRADTVLGQ